MENNCRVNIQTYHEAADTFSGLFFKIWVKNQIFISQNAGGAPASWQNFIPRSDRHVNSIKMTAMTSFIVLYTAYEATCTLTG